MKSLPEGNYALSIAHPGHELRLHGFLEQAKPWVFILTDGSHRTGADIMFESIKAIDKATKFGSKGKLDLKSDSWKKTFKHSFPGNPPEKEHIKDIQIFSELINQKTDFMAAHIAFMAQNFIKYDVDYLVADPSEGFNVVHEINRVMADAAIDLVKGMTGKQILNYDFAIDQPFNTNINDECIHIILDDDAVERKLTAMMKYPLAIMDLQPNITIGDKDYSLFMELGKTKEGKEEIKNILKERNIDFFKNEYLRPYSYAEPSGKPVYETRGEKAVKEKKYFNVITFKDHILPIREKFKSRIEKQYAR